MIHKGVNGIGAPRLVSHLRHCRALDGLVGPIGAGAVINLRIGLHMLGFAGNLVFGIEGSAHLHPLGKDIDLLLAQLFLGRHFVVAVLVRNHLQQQALHGLIKVDGRTDVATFQQALSAGYSKVAFQPLLGTVTFETAFLENPENLLIKELHLGRIGEFLCLKGEKSGKTHSGKNQ